MTVADVGESDFAVIVYREEDQWEADVLPTAVTADLDGFVQALRRQPIWVALTRQVVFRVPGVHSHHGLRNCRRQ